MLVVDGLHERLTAGAEPIVSIGSAETTGRVGRSIGVHHWLSPRQVDAVLAGGRIPQLARQTRSS